MTRMISTHAAVSHRLNISWLGKVEQAGFAAVEIFCARQHFDYRNKLMIGELGHWFRDSPLQLHSLHSPMFTDEHWGRSGPDTHVNITERGRAERIKWVDEIKRAIEVAEIVPFKYLVQHLGVTGQEFSEYFVDAAFSSLEELSVFARQRGVEILLENTPNELSTAERLELFNSMTHLRMNYVFDSGHAHLGAGVAHEFEIMKARIRSLHLHDNDGKEDQHLFPLAEGGTIDWAAAMPLLRSAPANPPLLLELREVADMENPLSEINRAADALEALAAGKRT